MLPSAAVRRHIESALEQRIPGALTSRPRIPRDLTSTGIQELDALLQGGVPIGAITELVGPPCSGRTTLALTILAGQTAVGKAVAWVDVSDTLDPESAAAAGVDLSRQLWVRCGHTSVVAPLSPPGSPQQTASATRHGAPLLVQDNHIPAPAGSCGSTHPRSEVHGLSKAVGAFMAGTPSAPNRKLTGSPQNANRPLPHRAHDRQEQTPTDRLPSRRVANPSRKKPAANTWADNHNNASGRSLQSAPSAIAASLRSQEMEARASGQGHGIERAPVTWKPAASSLRTDPPPAANASSHVGKPISPVWTALDQALRATDLLLAGGGFSAIVLDLGNIAPDIAWRIPLATWFRFRAAADRARTVLLVLTQHPCARSSAELVLRLNPAESHSAATVLTGAGFHVTIDRQRFDTPPESPQPIADEHPSKLHLVAHRKPPQSARSTSWQRSAAWARGGR